MARVPVAQPDGKKIRALIDEYIEQHDCTLTGFARKLGDGTRHPQSVWNICGLEVRTSTVLIGEIAAVLGVKPSDISDMADDSEEPIARRCPACGAEPGEKCVNPGGTPYSAGMHVPRRHPATKAA